MKLADRTVEIHSTGIESASRFNIAQTSKMFKILSDSLYSDKVMAVIRELSTNAHDSHIAANNPNPFKVTLPSNTNANFSVRDFGTGLSQSDMEHLYTTYGASNKNESNDFTGCLGLGSKSPFAYTKSFVTTSYFNGDQFTYIAAIDETGVPALNLLSHKKTTEPNGLEISFAVKTYDFGEFRTKAMRIYHYFKNKPIVNGGGAEFKNHSYSETNVPISGKNWRVCRLSESQDKFPNRWNNVSSGVVAIMGNIAYPVTTDLIIGQEGATQEISEQIAKWNRVFGKEDIKNWKGFLKEILNAGLYLELDFNIGELEMDVSREGLQYTKAVLKTIRQKTQDIYLDMKDQFTQKIQAAKTKVEANRQYHTLDAISSGWGVGASWVDPSGKSHSIGQDIVYVLPKNKSLFVVNYKAATWRSKRLICSTSQMDQDTFCIGRSRTHYSRNQSVRNPTVFFISDIKSEELAKKVAIRYCNDNGCYAYLMIDTVDHSKVEKGFDELREDVGETNILKVSDYKHLLVSSVRKSSTKKGTKSGSISDQEIFLILGDSTNDRQLLSEKPINDSKTLRTLSQDNLDSLILESQIVYVPITRYAPSGREYPELHAIRDVDLTSIIPKKQKIYAIKDSAVAPMIKNGYKLVDFNTFLMSTIKNTYSKHLSDTNNLSPLVDLCKGINSRSPCTIRSYRYQSDKLRIDRVFLYFAINTFGLDYKKHLGVTLTKIVDTTMVIDFFANTIHEEQFGIQRLDGKAYLEHITRLLIDIGLTSVDSPAIVKAFLLRDRINNLLESLYNRIVATDEKTKAKDDLVAELTAKITDRPVYNLGRWYEIDYLIDTLKKELDKNPLLRYIVFSGTRSEELRALKNHTSPLSQCFVDYDFANVFNVVVEPVSGNYLTADTQDQIETLRKQIGSIV